MGYIVEIVPKAEKEFLKLPLTERKKIRNKILSLEENPRPFGSKKLRETEYFRIRAGDYRVVYSPNFSGETFHVPKAQELRQFGEYHIRLSHPSQVRGLKPSSHGVSRTKSSVFTRQFH